MMPAGPSIKWMICVFIKLLRKSNANYSLKIRKLRKLRKLPKTGDRVVELTEIAIGLIVVAVFISGSITGWFLRQPRTITVASPDLEREKTIAEAQQQLLMEDITKHIADTEHNLVLLAERQTRLAAKLQGGPMTKEIAEQDKSDLILPPKDYSDSRGQL